MMASFSHFKSKVRRTLIIVGMIFFGINLYGTLGFMLIEGASLRDAFYMTVITITTVGYNEVIPLSAEGRFFAVSAIYLGLISSGFSVALLVNIFFEETLLEVLKGISQTKRISKLKKHFIVCGYGTTGRGIVKELLEQGDWVVVIDMEPMEDSHERLIFLRGDARRDEVLHQAGINVARGLATTLTEDADNVFVVLSARALNRGLILVSRFKNDDTEKKLKTAGVDHAVSPYRMGGHRLALALTNPPFLDVLDAALRKSNLKVRFQHVPLPPESPVSKRKLKDSEVGIYARGALIVAVIDKEGETILNPDPEFPMEQVAQLLVLGNDEEVTALRQFLQKQSPESVVETH